MKKRILSLLLILVMTLSLLPTAVLADEAETDYGITIVSPDATTQIDVTSKNYKDVMLDGTVSYDPRTDVLTLNDASLGYIRAYPNRETLKLRLVGNNTITTPQDIFSNALDMNSLSIEGNGRLHVKTQQYAANFYVGISAVRRRGDAGGLWGAEWQFRLGKAYRWKADASRRDAADEQASGCAGWHEAGAVR